MPDQLIYRERNKDITAPALSFFSYWHKVSYENLKNVYYDIAIKIDTDREYSSPPKVDLADRVYFEARVGQYNIIPKSEPVTILVHMSKKLAEIIHGKDWVKANIERFRY